MIMTDNRRTLIITRVKNGFLYKARLQEEPEIMMDSNDASFYTAIGEKLFGSAYKSMKVGNTYQMMADYQNLSQSVGREEKIVKENEEKVSESTPHDFYEQTASAMRKLFFFNNPPDCFLISTGSTPLHLDYYLFLGDAAVYVADMLEMEYSVSDKSKESPSQNSVCYLKISATKYNNMRLSLLGCRIIRFDANTLANIGNQYNQRLTKVREELQSINRKEIAMQKQREEEKDKSSSSKGKKGK